MPIHFRSMLHIQLIYNIFFRTERHFKKLKYIYKQSVTNMYFKWGHLSVENEWMNE